MKVFGIALATVLSLLTSCTLFIHPTVDAPLTGYESMHAPIGDLSGSVYLYYGYYVVNNGNTPLTIDNREVRTQYRELTLVYTIDGDVQYGILEDNRLLPPHAVRIAVPDYLYGNYCVNFKNPACTFQKVTSGTLAHGTIRVNMTTTVPPGKKFWDLKFVHTNKLEGNKVVQCSSNNMDCIMYLRRGEATQMPLIVGGWGHITVVHD